MARHIEDEVEYYYDSHSTPEDLMGETAFHRALVSYLVEVLRWLFQGQLCAIYDNLNIYQTTDPKEYPVAPDVAVIKGVTYELLTRSWRVGKSRPAPRLFSRLPRKKPGQRTCWKNLGSMQTWVSSNTLPVIPTNFRCQPVEVGACLAGSWTRTVRP